MKAAVIVFPGSNCDRDVAVCLAETTGQAPAMVWHREATLPECDVIVLPGGFSYGDYLRAGAIAAHSPIMKDVTHHARKGMPVLGICNGFQVLTETGLLPGLLMRNAHLKFVCRSVFLRVEATRDPFTQGYNPGDIVAMPVAHHDGNYYADEVTLDRLEGEQRILFRYCDEVGAPTPAGNPNGSARNIAGITNETGTIVGLMPHPERGYDPVLGDVGGHPLFASLMETLS
ncbi:MAG: phosphoribosylformylglycinamidine synthase subunit PurQ [Parvularculales bacterium]